MRKGNDFRGDFWVVIGISTLGLVLIGSVVLVEKAPNGYRDTRPIQGTAECAVQIEEFLAGPVPGGVNRTVAEHVLDQCRPAVQSDCYDPKVVDQISGNVRYTSDEFIQFCSRTHP